MISGFTIVRNAVRLDYPIVPAIRSILDLCDEVVVNVGRSDDETRDLVAAIGDPRVRILDTDWDFSRGSGVLAFETNRTMAAAAARGASTSRRTRCCTRPGRASCARSSPSGIGIRGSKGCSWIT